MTEPAIGLGVLAAAAGLYGLHRLALHLESKGLLYYRNRKPGGSSALGSFVALQQMIEPASKHVLTINELADTDDEAGDDKEPGQ